MIRALSSFLALALASAPSFGQSTEAPAFLSPCPSVFMYEPPGTEPGKWYGVLNLSTDITLHALWLNIVLDSKSDILGNWVGEVTTEDNMDFKIENTKMKIVPGQPLTIRFFVQYNSQNPAPRLQAIRFNGREICNVDNPLVLEPARADINFGEPIRINITTSTTLKPTTTTLKSQFWQQTKVENYKQQITTKSPYWTQTKTVSNYQDRTTNDVVKTTTISPYWTQTKIENNQNVKSGNKQPPALKPQQYWQANQETTTIKTTLKPQVWFQVKSDNNQRVTSGNKAQTISVDRPQTTTVGKVQSTAQAWSPTKVENNQQIKLQEKQQTRPEIRPQTTTENKSKLQPWSQIKVENDQQKKTQERITNSKLDEKYETSSNIRTKNLSHVVYEDTTQSQQWAQYNVEKKLQISEDQQLKPVKQTVVAVTEPMRFDTKFVIDETPSIQQANLQNKYSDSTSYNKHESSQQIKPDHSLQSQFFERLQTSTSESRQDQEQPRENIPVYVRPEDRQTVTQATFGARPRDNLQTKNKDIDRQQIRPVVYYQKTTGDRQENRDEERIEIRPIKIREQNTEERTSSWSGDRSRPYTEQAKESVFESAGDFTRYNDEGRVKTLDSSNTPYNTYQVTTDITPPAKYVVPEMDDFDNDNPKKNEETEYYFGGLPTFYIPNHGPRIAEPTCGKVYLNEAPVNSLKGSATLEGQWPWQIALYQQQTTVDFKYICGGTLVSRNHVITAAHCVTRKGSRKVVNKNTLTVYLGKHNLRTSVEGVQVRFVNRILVYPDYNATTLGRDLAILELREPVTYSNWVQPACLWPENETDLKNIVGNKGSVVGWGFEVTGVAREELSLLEMPVVSHRTCLKSSPNFYRRFVSDYTYCAGYRDGTLVCNGDSGGGMVFKKGDNWYLRGLASLSVARQGEYRCDPDHFVIFTDIAKFLPWIDENVEDY